MAEPGDNFSGFLQGQQPQYFSISCAIFPFVHIVVQKSVYKKRPTGPNISLATIVYLLCNLFQLYSCAKQMLGKKVGQVPIFLLQVYISCAIV